MRIDRVGLRDFVELYKLRIPFTFYLKDYITSKWESVLVRYLQCQKRWKLMSPDLTTNSLSLIYTHLSIVCDKPVDLDTPFQYKC